MPDDRRSSLLVVHDDPALGATVQKVLPGWRVAMVEGGDLAVHDAPHFGAVMVDLHRDPVDGWFVLARLAPTTDVIAIGTHRQVARALRLGAVAVVTDVDRLGSTLTPWLAA